MKCDYVNYFNNRAKSAEFLSFDLHRITAMFVQNGKCQVTGRVLEEKDRELHHRCPRHYGGEDTAINLMYVCKDVHSMIHTFDSFKFSKLMVKLQLNQNHIDYINQLRVEAHRLPIDIASQITA